MNYPTVDHSNDHGPFDIIGDLHGCFDELQTLLWKLDYEVTYINGNFQISNAQGRRVIFLGDLVDRGPKIVPVLKLVMGMVKQGIGLCVRGNHDDKLLRKLMGRNVQVKHGLAETLEQLGKESLEFRDEARCFLAGLPSHYVLDEGKLIVAHAGLKEAFHGIESKAAMDFALFGQPTGETDVYGLPVRYNWAGDYRGKPTVVYGHTPTVEAEWLNRTVNIDTGCVFGGKLTALLYPEMELTEVPALRTYAESAKPFLEEVVQK